MVLSSLIGDVQRCWQPFHTKGTNISDRQMRDAIIFAISLGSEKYVNIYLLRVQYGVGT